MLGVASMYGIFERKYEGRPGYQRGHEKREIRFARYPLRAARFLVHGNPVGLMKEQPFMRKLTNYINTCSQCRYGRPYRKNTKIWSNATLMLKTCSTDTPCSTQRRHGRHFVTAQSGPNAEARGSGRRENVYGIPCPLVYDLFTQGLEFCGK